MITSPRDSQLPDTAGHDYVSATGGLCVARGGDGREELAEIAAKRMRAVEYPTSFWEFTDEPAIRLTERLPSLESLPISHAYLTSRGLEDYDTAIQLSRLHLRRRGQAAGTRDDARDLASDRPRRANAASGPARAAPPRAAWRDRRSRPQLGQSLVLSPPLVPRRWYADRVVDALSPCRVESSRPVS